MAVELEARPPREDCHQLVELGSDYYRTITADYKLMPRSGPIGLACRINQFALPVKASPSGTRATTSAIA